MAAQDRPLSTLMWGALKELAAQGGQVANRWKLCVWVDDADAHATDGTVTALMGRGLVEVSPKRVPTVVDGAPHHTYPLQITTGGLAVLDRAGFRRRTAMMERAEADAYAEHEKRYPVPRTFEAFVRVASREGTLTSPGIRVRNDGPTVTVRAYTTDWVDMTPSEAGELQLALHQAWSAARTHQPDPDTIHHEKEGHDARP